MYQVGVRRSERIHGSIEEMVVALERTAGSVVSSGLGGDTPTQDAMARRIDPVLLENCLSLGNTLLDVYLYWASKVSWDRIPSRDELSPLEIPRFLPFLGLVDFLRPSGEFRYRLTGTAIADAIGKDCAGTIVGGADDPSPFGKLDEAAFAESVHQTRIIYSRRKLVSVEGQIFRFDRLALPLRGKNGVVDMLLFVHDCDWWVIDADDPPRPPVDLFMPVRCGSIVEIDEVNRYTVSPADVLDERPR